MKIYWKLVFERFSNEVLLRQFTNPIREYESELIDGAIVDIGCGQSPFLLDFISSENDLIAIDNEQNQLDFLQQRLQLQSPEKQNRWMFLNQSFPQDGLPDRKYSLIILSNFLHFYSLDDCIEIVKFIKGKSSIGTLVYICVHSEKFYANNPEDPNNNIYFKHYFTKQDLELVFPANNFEILYYAEIDKVDSKIEKDLTDDWLDQCIKGDGITNPKVIKKIKEDCAF